jgi:hypothetical protein
VAIAALEIAVVAALGACGGPTPSPPASGLIAPSAPATASANASAGLDPTPTEPLKGVSVAPVGVAVDPSLLDLVPASDAGAVLIPDAATSATVAADPALATDVNYLAVGLARPRGAAADDPNFAIVNVVRLRDPGVSGDEEWFRDWRDSYDTAACGPAGGVARHAETEVDRLPVYIAGCGGGAFTYHVRIADGAMILSITSVGPGDLGRKIVEKLHR